MEKIIRFFRCATFILINFMLWLKLDTMSNTSLMLTCVVVCLEVFIVIYYVFIEEEY